MDRRTLTPLKSQLSFVPSARGKRETSNCPQPYLDYSYICTIFQHPRYACSVNIGTSDPAFPDGYLSYIDSNDMCQCICQTPCQWAYLTTERTAPLEW